MFEKIKAEITIKKIGAVYREGKTRKKEIEDVGLKTKEKPSSW